jgi:hypothetical protein
LHWQTEILDFRQAAFGASSAVGIGLAQALPSLRLVPLNPCRERRSKGGPGFGPSLATRLRRALDRRTRRASESGTGGMAAFAAPRAWHWSCGAVSVRRSLGARRWRHTSPSWTKRSRTATTSCGTTSAAMGSRSRSAERRGNSGSTRTDGLSPADL